MLQTPEASRGWSPFRLSSCKQRQEEEEEEEEGREFSLRSTWNINNVPMLASVRLINNPNTNTPDGHPVSVLNINPSRPEHMSVSTRPSSRFKVQVRTE